MRIHCGNWSDYQTNTDQRDANPHIASALAELGTLVVRVLLRGCRRGEQGEKCNGNERFHA
jgi:hypothetical protein